MSKQTTINFRVEQDQKDLLVQMAAKHRVSPAHIYREAIHEYIQAHAPNGVCPECGSAEINRHDPHNPAWRADDAARMHCADCGADWEID